MRSTGPTHSGSLSRFSSFSSTSTEGTSSTCDAQPQHISIPAAIAAWKVLIACLTERPERLQLGVCSPSAPVILFADRERREVVASGRICYCKDMTSFDRIDEVQPSTKFGNTGPDGWGFTLWGSSNCPEEVHRGLLEAFFRDNPDCCLRLPSARDREDLIEGSMIWRGVPIWVWFETVLNYTWLWSPDESCTVDLRRAMLPLVEVA